MPPLVLIFFDKLLCLRVVDRISYPYQVGLSVVTNSYSVAVDRFEAVASGQRFAGANVAGLAAYLDGCYRLLAFHYANHLDLGVGDRGRAGQAAN